MHTQVNSEDQDEMPYIAAFYQILHCLLRQKQSSEKGIQFKSEKGIQFNWEIITCDPSKYTMDHSKFNVSNQKEESISA